MGNSLNSFENKIKVKDKSFIGIRVFMRAFYDILNIADSIFSSSYFITR